MNIIKQILLKLGTNDDIGREWNLERLRLKRLKTFIELDLNGRHDSIPQFYFDTADLRWLIQQAEKAEKFKQSLRTISEDMTGKESSELMELARKALKD
jgi:hypothetical protein